MNQIKAMFEEMENNADFNKEITDLIEKGNLSDVLEAASKKGINITEADWDAYRISESKRKKQKLSEAELTDVAGGKDGTISNPRKSTNCFFIRNFMAKTEIIYGEKRDLCARLWCLNVQDGYWECRCWGTIDCIDKWHSTTRCG